ncbi:MAG: amidohydrolase family protein [Parvibaculum sp.]|nr:amidohydrolase family protein [Parvibaculum sp.]
MKIDAHQHVWQLSQPFCNWPTSVEAAIYRDFQPADLAPLLAEQGVTGTILVQAAPALAETKYILGVADKASFVCGVVGWVDMESDAAIEDLKSLAAHPKFRGIRPMLQSIDDPLWVLEPRFDPVFRTLIDLDLTFDALILPHHVQVIRELARRYPVLTIIIDHAAKPPIRAGGAASSGFASWSRDMARLALEANVACKISGLFTEARAGAGLSELRPWLNHLFEKFGSARLMWGSDWPVLNLASDYASWHMLCENWLLDKAPTDAKNIWGVTAARLYRIIE